MSLLIPDIAGRTVTVYRTTPGSYVSGRWVDGAESSFDIYCSEQPANGEELKVLPEGKRSDDVRKIYADTRLFELDEKTGQQADQIDFEGERYEVSKVWVYYFSSSFGYNKALLTRL